MSPAEKPGALMSVALTEPAVRARAKTVTRRMGWRKLKAGDRLQLCRKVMGRRPGEPLVRVARARVLAVNREPLSEISAAEVEREGFPGWSPERFVEFFCASHKGCTPDSEVTRIQFEYIEEEPCAICRDGGCLFCADGFPSKPASCGCHREEHLGDGGRCPGCGGPLWRVLIETLGREEIYLWCTSGDLLCAWSDREAFVGA